MTTQGRNSPCWVDTAPQEAGRSTNEAVLQAQAVIEGAKTMNANNIQQPDGQATAPAVIDIHHISQQQLAMLGMQQIAYIKPVVVDGAPAFAIHAADGTPMAVAQDRDVAVAAIMQHEMAPALVH
jgi:hypothetical protein